MNTKKSRFAQEYIIDLNATKAAVRAGYSEKTAYSIGQRLLKNVEVQAEIQRLMSQRVERTEVDADYVVNRLIEIDQMDVLDIMDDAMSLKPVSEWPKSWRQYLSGFDLADMFEGSGDDRKMVGILKKIKWPDKIKNLELLGRHLGVFKDKLEVTGPNGGPVNLSTEERAAKISELLGGKHD